MGGSVCGADTAAVREDDAPLTRVPQLDIFAANPKTAFRFPRPDLQPKLRLACGRDGSGMGEKDCRWEVNCDFTSVPAGQWRNIVVESSTPATFLERGTDSTSLSVQFPTVSQVDFWILMPRGKEYRGWHIVRHMQGQTGSAEALKPATEFLSEDGQILAFKLLAVKPSYRYEISWEYK